MVDSITEPFCPVTVLFHCIRFRLIRQVSRMIEAVALVHMADSFQPIYQRIPCIVPYSAFGVVRQREPGATVLSRLIASDPRKILPVLGSIGPIHSAGLHAIPTVDPAYNSPAMDPTIHAWIYARQRTASAPEHRPRGNSCRSATSPALPMAERLSR